MTEEFGWGKDWECGVLIVSYIACHNGFQSLRRCTTMLHRVLVVAERQSKGGIKNRIVERAYLTACNNSLIDSLRFDELFALRAM